MYQDTTAILCIEKLKIEPAVTYIAELSPILRAASDAYLAAFFFLSLSASSVYSVLCPASQRHHHVVQSLPKTSLSHCSHQISKFTSFVKSVFSYFSYLDAHMLRVIVFELTSNNFISALPSD